MAASYDITEYYKGEGLNFTAALKNRDGTVLSTAASQLITIRFGPTAGGSAVVEYSTTPQVVLTDAPTALWTFLLPASDLSAVPEGSIYWYNIWSKLSTDNPILQIRGNVTLKDSIEG